jgi:hypothetical protein
MLYCYANLTDEQLAKIKAFEAETGKKALALRRVPVRPEELSAEDLAKWRRWRANWAWWLSSSNKARYARGIVHLPHCTRPN